MVTWSAIRQANTYPTAKGNSTGTGSQQTIAHGLGAIPFYFISINETACDLVNCWADATNLYITVTSGIDYKWKAEL